MEHALLVATDVALQSGVSSWRRRVVVRLLCSFVCSCFLEENHAWRGVLLESCSQVDVARFQNRIGFLRLSPGCGAPGPWRRLANNDRDVV